MSKKPNKAHVKSVQVYNTKMSDIKNKEKKLKKHAKKHPLDILDILKIMKDYIAKRFVRSREKSTSMTANADKRKLTS